MTQVFISYSRKDLAFVERLAEDLKAAGLEVWYDLSGLEIGAHWGKEIQAAIRRSQYFIVVLSPHSVDSEWVEKEYIYARNHELKAIPLIYESCDLPLWSVDLHYIDMQGGNYQSQFGVLLKVLGVQPVPEGSKVEPAALPLPEKGIVEEQIPPPPVRKPKFQRPASSRPVDKPESKRTAPSYRKRKILPAWVIALAVLVALLAFAVWGMPLLATRLAPTPTATSTPTATTTQAPTSTPTLTLVPSPTLTATATLDPTTGIVTGSIWWANQPYKGVVVNLCTKWLYTCNGIEFTGVTQSDGTFTIPGVSAGEYQLITKYPGQKDETRANGKGGLPISVKVMAGQEIDLDPISICKMDLTLSFPTINQGNWVTFYWNAYPGVTDYRLEVVGNTSWQTTATRSTIILDPGSYQLVITTIGDVCSRGILNFTVP